MSTIRCTKSVRADCMRSSPHVNMIVEIRLVPPGQIPIFDRRSKLRQLGFRSHLSLVGLRIVTHKVQASSRRGVDRTSGCNKWNVWHEPRRICVSMVFEQMLPVGRYLDSSRTVLLLNNPTLVICLLFYAQWASILSLPICLFVANAAPAK